MKLKKAEISIIIITIVFVSFTVGFFVGRSHGEKNINISVAENNSAFSDEISEKSDTGETAEPETAFPDAAESTSQKAKIVNINTATADELETLPGIGQVLATRIIEYREQNGGFENEYEITQVRGIGEKIFSQIKEYISV